MSAQSDCQCLLARVEGRVQGVGYRESCVQQAQALGLLGWVRNRVDGSVEILMQGPAEAVASLQKWMHHGPPLARVGRVIIDAQPLARDLAKRFERRPTA